MLRFFASLFLSYSRNLFHCVFGPIPIKGAGKNNLGNPPRNSTNDYACPGFLFLFFFLEAHSPNNLHLSIFWQIDINEIHKKLLTSKYMSETGLFPFVEKAKNATLLFAFLFDKMVGKKFGEKFTTIFAFRNPNGYVSRKLALLMPRAFQKSSAALWKIFDPFIWRL